MSKLQWWAYLHTNGTVQVKRFFSRIDLTEAKESDFVQDVMLPFYAEGREDALLQAAEHFDIWLPMMPALVPDSEKDKVREICRQNNIPEDQIDRHIKDACECPVFRNNKYQCSVHEQDPLGEGFPALWHLSIKRLDKEPIFDWRHIQNIKNDIIGPEHEGVQLFPAESRKVDGANQYHLFVLKDDKIRFPFGFHEGRKVSDEAQGGGKQRPGAND